MNIRNRVKSLRMVPANDLRPNPKNWRTHPDAQRDALRGILAEVGLAAACLARELPDGSLMLIDGHLRAETLGDGEVPVLILDVNEAEADKILATLDPLAAMADSDAVKLDELLRTVDTGSDALQQMLAATADAAGLYQDAEPPPVIEDEAPAPPADPITKPGDLWILGEHRLLCGDSRDANNVARLTGGKRIDIMFTSPPYNVGGSTMGGHLKTSDAHSKYVSGNDNLEASNYLSLLCDTTRNAINHCEYAIVNIQMLAANKRVLIEWLNKFSAHFCDVAIWNKGHGPPAMGDNVLNAAFEFLFVFANKENPSRRIATADFRGNVNNVYTATRGEVNQFADVHAATFPVHLPCWVIRTFSAAGDVMDLFCGTGTTQIAAEQLGRKCYGMEISPQYCDVIVSRWETLTGKKATLEK